MVRRTPSNSGREASGVRAMRAAVRIAPSAMTAAPAASMPSRSHDTATRSAFSMDRLEPVPEDRDLPPAKVEDRDAPGEDGEREHEEEPAVVHDHDPEVGEMAHDRAHDHAEREEGAQSHGRRDQEERRRDQLRHAGADPSPGLQPELREDVHGFGGARELEEEGLEEDGGDADLEEPAQELRAALDGAGDRTMHRREVRYLTHPPPRTRSSPPPRSEEHTSELQ